MTDTTYTSVAKMFSTHTQGHTIVSVGDRHIVHAGLHEPGADHGPILHEADKLDDAVLWVSERAAQPQLTMEQLWASWATAALPSSASLQQRASMKTAFMSGAATMLGQILSSGQIPRDSDVGQSCERLGGQLAEFMRIIQSGIEVRQRHDAEQMMGTTAMTPLRSH
jgi:hypothetical protein